MEQSAGTVRGTAARERRLAKEQRLAAGRLAEEVRLLLRRDPRATPLPARITSTPPRGAEGGGRDGRLSSPPAPTA